MEGIRLEEGQPPLPAPSHLSVLTPRAPGPRPETRDGPTRLLPPKRINVPDRSVRPPNVYTYILRRRGVLVCLGPVPLSVFIHHVPPPSGGTHLHVV